MARILGLSGSLRNARTSSNSTLCSDIRGINTQKELLKYLKSQTTILVDAFLEAGKGNEDSYLKTYESLRAKARDQGLSNSEAGLVCGLWAASQEGCEIEHLSLARHFPPAGQIMHADELKRKIVDSDGLLISGPVYFGDRSSLVQSFIDFCYQDDEILSHLQGKVYAGISVGAKRNGGQETSLIYQMLDMVNMGMLSVGNDSKTTSQYGGTVVAGDIGKLIDDDYGIRTCISTGSRIAHVSQLEVLTKEKTFTGKVKIHMLLLQDSKDRKGLKHFNLWISDMKKVHPEIEIVFWDVVSEKVIRCIACDICPTDVGVPKDYRCIITRKDDFMVKYHKEIVDADALLICAYNTENRKELLSYYQQFMERTRYIRRDNYLYSDLLVSPFVISELSARQNIHIRIMTSLIRHQTILSHPLIGMIQDGIYINENEVRDNSIEFIERAAKISQSRIDKSNLPDSTYQPVGYIISKHKMENDKKSGRLDKAINSAKIYRKKKQSKRMNDA